MIPFSGIPFLRFIIAFIAGIFFYLFIQPATDYFFLSLASLFLYLIIFLIQKFKREYFHFLNPYLGISALLTLFWAGASLTYVTDDVTSGKHLLNQKERGQAYEAIVISNPEEKANSYKVELNVRKLFIGDSTLSTSSYCYLYLSKKNYNKEQLTYGDRILIKGWPEEIQAPLNPFEFDYKKRSRFVHVYHQHFIASSDYAVVGTKEGNPIVAFAFILRTKADEIIRQYVPGKEEQNIASALLLGLKNSLSQEIKDVYSTTGTTHVLAVSGMHVTVLFQLLLSLFVFVKSKRFRNYILPLFLLAVLWLYVLVTGFSPSVLRAGVMFTLIILGKLIGRDSNIYNSVLVSAFALLCYDPFIIMDVGFQLSYLAVLGLLFFTNRIYSLMEFNYRIADWIWNTIAVSIAAQIITLPLCIYYFHQIPLSALLSNLIAVPISTALLYLGIVLLICSYIPMVPKVIGYVFGLLIQWMNASLEFISSFHFATIKSIHFELIHLLIVYLLILFITAFIVRRKHSYFIISFSFLLAFAGLLIFQIIQTKNQKRVIVYNIKNQKVLAFIQGSRAYLIGDSLSEDNYRFHIEPSMIAYGISSIVQNKKEAALTYHSQPEFDLFVFHNKSFLLTNNISSGIDLPAADFIVTNRKEASKLKTTGNSKVIISAGGKADISEDYYDMNQMPAIVMEVE